LFLKKISDESVPKRVFPTNFPEVRLLNKIRSIHVICGFQRERTLVENETLRTTGKKRMAEKKRGWKDFIQRLYSIKHYVRQG